MSAYFVKRILGLLLRVLWQLLHFYKAVQLRLSCRGVILKDVNEVGVHDLREDAMADRRESQNYQDDPRHAAAASAAAAAAALLGMTARAKLRV
ncbi:hypothetical protein EYF80_002319 [Liparis tanakae]|uniref:Secreted protein n=1 Tax=Liparis tanakae TaxID=230148 RepID=A0A4Z2JED5_9TELE|nr:hypothetical protein EYF80_002319 [Liparis tanakae]